MQDLARGIVRFPENFQFLTQYLYSQRFASELFDFSQKFIFRACFFTCGLCTCAGVDGKNYGVDESIFNLNRLQFVHLAPDKLYSCSLVPNFDTLHCLVMAKLSGNNVK